MIKNNSLTIIKNYVEGLLSPQNFQKELYYNKDMENILSEETQIPSYIKAVNFFTLFLKLIYYAHQESLIVKICLHNF